MKKTLALIFLITLAIACSSDEEAGVNSSYQEPFRFFTEATLDGQALEFNAGEENYALFTTHSIDNGVVTMQSVLAQDSTDLRNALVIVLRGDENSTGQVFTEGVLPWRSPTGFTQQPNQVNYTFTTNPGHAQSIVNWYVNGGAAVNDDTLQLGPIHTQQQPDLAVTLLSAGAVTCVPRIEYELQTASTDQALLNLNPIDSLTLQAEVSVNQGTLSSVEWRLNNQLQTADQPKLQIGPGQASYPLRISAEVGFASGHRQKITKEVMGPNINCDQSLFFSRSPLLESNPLNTNTVELIYYDVSGTPYRTLHQYGAFTIEQVMPYGKKSLGSGEHMQIHFAGSGLLKSDNGDTLSLDQVSGSFAFELP